MPPELAQPLKIKKKAELSFVSSHHRSLCAGPFQKLTSGPHHYTKERPNAGPPLAQATPALTEGVVFRSTFLTQSNHIIRLGIPNLIIQIPQKFKIFEHGYDTKKVSDFG